MHGTSGPNEALQARQIPALDGLRGIAIAAVMVFHFTLYGPYSNALMRGLPAIGPALHLAMAGWGGVDLFFVLSGYLITAILLRTKAAPGYFRRFYARRVLRIFPLYYLFLAVGIALSSRLPPAWSAEGSWQLWLWTYLTNFKIGSAGWSSVPRAYEHFWSLAVEEQFYLLWPLLVFKLDERRLARVCGAMIAFALLFRVDAVLLLEEPVLGYVSTLGRVDELAAGGLLATLLVIRGREEAARQLPARWLLALGGGALTGLALLWWQRDGLSHLDPVVVVLGPTLLAGLASAAVAVCVTWGESNRLARLLTFAPLRWMGRVSYGLYVLHTPVLVTLFAWRPLAQVLAWPELRTWWVALAAQYLLPTAVTAALAALSWVLFERPLLGLKARFA